MKKMMLAATVALSGVTAAMPSWAAPILNITTPGSTYGGGAFTLGFEFSVSAPQFVTQLGVFDDNGNGLTGPASIGLWDLQGNLLTSAAIATGGGVLDGLFRYVSISPFALTAGTHYVVGAYTNQLASSYNTGQGGAGSVNPLVTIYRDRYAGVSSLMFPTSSNQTTGAWLGANVQLAASAVPETATWGMMIAGFGVMGAVLRSRRRSTRVSFA